MDKQGKYRYTKQLISMAQRDGWTQTDIAESCRVSQSIVSDWKKGKKQATEIQLRPLLEIFGSKLRRRAFKVYHALRADENDGYHVHVIKVEGEVMLSFPYRNAEFCLKCHLPIEGEAGSICRCGTRRIAKYLPTRKLVVHAMGKGEFCVVAQSRLIRDEHLMRFPQTNIFESEVVGRYSVESLLPFLDGLCTSDDGVDRLSLEDGLMLQMLARKAMLEHGDPVDGIEEHRAAW
jgi:transcriptional regulator with XRE-family HTH domain